MLGEADRSTLLVDHLNDVIQNAKRCPLILNVYWEKEFNTDIVTLILNLKKIMKLGRFERETWNPAP